MQTKKRIAPIRLISIETEGFSYFPRQEVIFHEGMTAAIGENGSGKTTFNNMLRLLFGASKFDNGHTLRTFFEREDISEIYVVGKFCNAFQTNFNLRPFEPIGKKEDVVSVVCRLVLSEPQITRNYLINDGIFNLETDLKKKIRWLEVDQFHKQFHEVGISKALIRSFSLSQGNTEEVLKKDEEDLANYLLEICGEQERIDEFHRIKKKIMEQQQQFHALSEYKQLEEARVRLLQDRIERCKQINSTNKKRNQFIFDKPISEYTECLGFLQEYERSLVHLNEKYQNLKVEIEELTVKLTNQEKQLPEMKSHHKKLKEHIQDLFEEKVTFELELSRLSADINGIKEFLINYEKIEPIPEEVIEEQVNSCETIYQDAVGHFKRVQSNKIKIEQSIHYLEIQGAVEFPSSVKEMLRTLKENGIEHLLVADYIEVLDESWRESIEALLGNERFTITVSEKSLVDVMKIAQRHKYPYWVSPFRTSTIAPQKNSILQKVKILDHRIAGYLEQFQHYMMSHSIEEAYKWVGKGKKAILNKPSPYKVVSRGGRSIKSNGKYCGKEAFRSQLIDKKQELSLIAPTYNAYEIQMNESKLQLQHILGVKEEQQYVRQVPLQKKELSLFQEKQIDTQTNFSALNSLISEKKIEETTFSTRYEKFIIEKGKLSGVLGEKKTKGNEFSDQIKIETSAVEKARNVLLNKESELTEKQLTCAQDAEYIEGIATSEFYKQSIKELEHQINILRKISSSDFILVGEEMKMIQLEQKYKQHQKVLLDHQEEISRVTVDLEELGDKHKVAEQEYHIMVDEVFSMIRKSLAELCLGTNIQAELRAFHIGEERWKVDYRIAFHGKELKSYRIKTELSGGQKVIASLLLTFAAIRSDGSLSFMILDEPFAHLDQERINVAGDFLRQTGVQFFIAMPYSENVKLFMPWVDMQINFRPKGVNQEVAPPLTYGVVNDEYLKQRQAI